MLNESFNINWVSHLNMMHQSLNAREVSPFCELLRPMHIKLTLLQHAEEEGLCDRC